MHTLSNGQDMGERTGRGESRLLMSWQSMWDLSSETSNIEDNRVSAQPLSYG